ncbi:O-antigen ligase family protein [Novosphingobium album (ex Liu et al. 2023)]|uniref:O-antigen ligase domain-containing protein n=1 Tax=Novosphingobium album (ex Liu et al. 2023) TaxID=3031130 RepID=A0ABT5WTH3_9SPHN|nr:hypothetical protein [Novosphingobium album (ex Liu et al. 2023)]MDE8653182.1 hypothetical protein [Novosphingobium album (ex Liu et al. 2023)]
MIANGQGETVFENSWRDKGLPAPEVRLYSPSLYPFFILLIVLNVAIPKAGIAFGGTPLTFGYLALLGLTPLGLIFIVQQSRISSVAAANFLYGYVPISAFALFKLMYLGSNLVLVAFIGILLVFPAIMLLIYAPIVDCLTDRQIGTTLKWSIRFAVAWGLFNFALYAVTKRIIEIPYLTVNPLDLGNIYEKNNARGELMKLVSTYNNGNLFGVCLVMLFPVYAYFEKSRSFLGACCLAIVCTLSRTVWFGFLGLVLIMTLLGLIRAGRPAFWLVGAGLLIVGSALVPLMGWTPMKVVQPTIGGRIVYWQELVLSPFGTPEVRVREVLYAGLLQSFGIVGTCVALIAFLFPVVYAIAKIPSLNPLRRSAFAGIAAYLLMAFSDAAFIYPPTIVIFLFMVTLLYRADARPASPILPVTSQTSVLEPSRALSLAQAARRIP